MVQSLILVFALCMDTFVASMAYGAHRVEVSWGKAVLLNAICSGSLGLALGLGTVLDALVPENLARVICTVSLILLGLVKCLDYGIKEMINRSLSSVRSLRFSLSGLQVIIHIYGDPMAADADNSKSLGWRETIFLALAMSIDSLGVGTMAAFLDLSGMFTVALAFVLGIGTMEAGLWLGKKAAMRWNCDLGWVSGALLIALGVMKALGG
ncbi:manganese efflux pump [Lacrimispora sp. 210928-DFI.3.58]|uniref:manganese efflux pump n=1 Tax=Lacrimispora sp. 210928-DFI.3.58 TaxID=2883214 RepID=UPI001D08B39F|nr:manganese efflux pump [Lacrimispora sp. 210928-DFI.3.58]MCB7318393.1 manganese efflux pump [Lacrimispora sp. 210928-DFI.3.58]